MTTSSHSLLSIRDLTVEFRTDVGTVRAVDGISFDVAPGETVGIVGESGCGKSVTALAILGLIPTPPGRIVAPSSIRLEGRELVGLKEAQLRKVRGSQVTMIFQEPMTALNPVFTLASQMIDVIRVHQSLGRTEARREAERLLTKVGIPSPARRLDEYPHQLSGGMRQRVMIAMALASGPKLLVADEPTTALDVTTQATVLEQMKQLQSEYKMATMLITHDLGVIAETCQRVIVMYCGKIVEMAPVSALFTTPRHPYTKGLLDSVPRIRPTRLAVLPTIEGRVPDLTRLPSGCRFRDRCPRALEQCGVSQPPIVLDGMGREVACFNPHPGGGSPG